MILRLIVAAVAIYCAVWSVRLAIADQRAQRNLPGLETAIAMEPADSVLLARAALFKNNNGDMSESVDRQLLQAARMDPLNSALPTALGLREEFRGHLAESERYLVHAADIDHTFKPAWTLAAFYVRNNQPEKSWPSIRRVLNLNPLAYDLTPVFDLCWNQTTNSKQILDLIPSRGGVPIQYLYYLIARKRFDAAMDVWPRAIGAVDPSDPASAESMSAFPEYLIQANRASDAVRVWNQLVARGIVNSGKLDPAAGISIADPDFRFTQTERGFAWRVMQGAIKTSPGIKFEFDGEEPESLVLLTTIAPLIPGKSYRVIWTADASQLSSPRDPGFVLQIANSMDCQPLLQTCRFTAKPDRDWAQINLLYKRALGTTRARGQIEIKKISMEPAQ